MDTIQIEDQEVWAHVGVPDAERATPQRLLISTRLERSLASAAASDDLTRTIDYHAVTLRIAELCGERPRRLIETLAGDAAVMILREFHPDAVEITIKKFILPNTRHVSVTIRRTAHGTQPSP